MTRKQNEKSQKSLHTMSCTYILSGMSCIGSPLRDVPRPICRLLLNPNDEVDSTDLGSANHILITLRLTADKPIAGSLNYTSVMFRVEERAPPCKQNIFVDSAAVLSVWDLQICISLTKKKRFCCYNKQ